MPAQVRTPEGKKIKAKSFTLSECEFRLDHSRIDDEVHSFYSSCAAPGAHALPSLALKAPSGRVGGGSAKYNSSGVGQNRFILSPALAPWALISHNFPPTIPPTVL